MSSSTGGDRGLVQRARDARARVQPVMDRVKGLRVMRAMSRFGREGGAVLTGGIAYSTLFSVVAGLTIGWTVFTAVLGGNENLRQGVLDVIDSWLPGLLGPGGAISPSDLQLSSALTTTGAVAAVVLLFSAMAAVRALRTGVRAMFAQPPVGKSPVMAQVRAFIGFLGMAAAILVSAVLSIVTTSLLDWLRQITGIATGDSVLLRLSGPAVSLVVDMGLFVLIVVVLAEQHPPRRDLFAGALLAAVGIGVVRYLGTSVVAGAAGKNALLASFAAIATLLVWVNLMARIVLLAAAWTADPPLPDEEPQDAGDEPEEAGDEPQDAGDEPEEAGDEPEEAGDEPEEEAGDGSGGEAPERVGAPGPARRPSS